MRPAGRVREARWEKEKRAAKGVIGSVFKVLRETFSELLGDLGQIDQQVKED